MSAPPCRGPKAAEKLRTLAASIREATGDPATRGGAILLANALAEALAASGAPHPEDPAEIPRILEQ